MAGSWYVRLVFAGWYRRIKMFEFLEKGLDIACKSSGAGFGDLRPRLGKNAFPRVTMAMRWLLRLKTWEISREVGPQAPSAGRQIGAPVCLPDWMAWKPKTTINIARRIEPGYTPKKRPSSVYTPSSRMIGINMFPPIENAVLQSNPDFAALYGTLTTALLNGNGSTKDDPAAKERIAVQEVRHL